MLTIGELVRRHGRTWAGHPAYLEFGRSVTWAEFDARTDALGHALRRAGVGPGERVAMLSIDAIEVAELFVACAKIGAVRVGINYRQAAGEIAQLIDDAAPLHLFVQAELKELADRALEQAKARPQPVGFGGTHGYAEDYEDWIARGRREGALQLAAQDLLMLCYTSGSTGLPKGALYRHGQMLDSIMRIALCEGAGRDDVWLQVMPAGGVPILHMCRNLFHGSTVAILGRWNPEKALELIARSRATIGVFVPTMLSALLASPALGRTDTSSLRQFEYGASPLPPAAIRAGMAAFGCPFLQMYGTTELCGMSHMLYPSDHRRGLAERPEILASCGRALPYVETRIVDDEDHAVGAGEVGELIVRTDLVVSGYWRQPEKYAETVREGWLYTGDLARQDEEGYVYLGDRKNFRIKTGGYNVFPTEVENVLAEHPAVHEIAVVGLADERWGERIHAVVSLLPGTSLTADELRRFAQGRIADYKLPKSVEVWPELPKGATGKILKRRIIEACRAKEPG
jgi:acyl-CoA synthetase (AMP-forming)/AMP-acid ligase II